MSLAEGEKNNKDESHLSIIIPTYNGANKIVNLLESLKCQSCQEYELIIIVDGSSDNTLEVLKDKINVFKNYKIIEQGNRGRSISRNIGAQNADGSILLFYDDDVIPATDSVFRHLDFHSHHLNSIIGGNLYEAAKESNTDFQDYIAYLSKKWTRKYGNEYHKLDLQNIFLSAANFSIPKKLFRKLKGFDEKLSDSEDFDLAVRALEDGISVYFDKENTASHENHSDIFSYIKRQREYWKSTQFLFSIKPNTYRVISETRKYKTGIIKKWIYSALSRKIILNWINREKLNWLPLFTRYKIYDIVITGYSKVYPDRRI